MKADYGTRHIMFWDDTLTMKRSTVEKYCHAFVDSRLGVSWKAATRADLIDDDLLGLMKKAGCVKLEIGVESGSDRIKKLIYKDVNNEQIEKAFRLINNAGIGSGAFFMAGFPEETIADLEDTFNLMKRLDATEMSFNIFDPMPGSDEYEKCKKMGLVPESPDWSAFPFWPDAHYAGMMARGEFDAKAVEIAEWLYGRNNSFRYKWRRNRQYIMSLAANDPMEAARKIAGFARRRWTVARRRDEK